MSSNSPRSHEEQEQSPQDAPGSPKPLIAEETTEYKLSSFMCWKLNKERLSWYLYDGGVSVIPMLTMVMFVPIYLSNTAIYASSPANSELASCKVPFDQLMSSPDSGRCLTCKPGVGVGVWSFNGDKKGFAEQTGRVTFLGFQFEAKAFPTAVITFSTLLQAVLFVSVGEFADRGNGRKIGLLLFSFIGQAALIGLFANSNPASYALAATFVTIANCCFGICFVYFNAYMPLLVEVDPKVSQTEGEERVKSRERIQNTMSSYGFATAYSASFILAIAGAALHVLRKSTPGDGYMTDRLCFLVHGLWWLSMTIPAMLWLKPRTGKPFEGGYLRIAVSGWTEAWKLLKEAHKYPETFKFLLCFFFYMDTITTIATVGVLFGTQELCIPTHMMALLMVMLLFFASLGNLFYLYIYKRFDLRPKSVLIWILGVYSFICFWGCVGIFTTKMGMTSQIEMFIFAAVHGFHTGSLQSFSRTLFADLIIPGREGQFFSLYQITDKGGSWIGPLAVSIIQSYTGKIRFAFPFLLFLALGSMIMFWKIVDPQKGLVQVGRLTLKT